jgi:hypothetical protein
MGPQFVGPSASACLSLDVTRSLETHMHPNCRLQVPGTRSRSISAMLTFAQTRPLSYLRTCRPAQTLQLSSTTHFAKVSHTYRILNPAIRNPSRLPAKSIIQAILFPFPTIPPPSRSASTQWARSKACDWQYGRDTLGRLRRLTSYPWT